MAEKAEEMQQFQELLQDEGLRSQVTAANDVQEVSRILNGAGEPKGYRFEDEWLTQLFDDVQLTRPKTFTEQELMLLASTHLEMWSQPKLCHTESCGGHAGACC
jgi:hypothetical protein